MDPNAPKEGAPPENAEPKPGESVSYESHQRLLNQRKEDQRRADAAEAEAKRLRDAAAEVERKRLEEAQAYKDLYEKEKTLRESNEKLIRDREEADKLAAKRRALRSELGDGVKDEYLHFANLGAIPVNADGTPDSQAVKDVAAKFRKDHPGLLGAAPPPLPGAAGSGFAPQAGKPLAALTPDEALALYRRQRAEGKIKI